MAITREILSQTTHRPWLLPESPWRWYQEWNKALFLHWTLPAEVVRPLVPTRLLLDRFNGQTWISLVASRMEKIRPRNLPPVSALSDFYEINLRAYVSHNGKAGVYFLNIEAEKFLSVLIARTLSGLPYEKAAIARSEQGNMARYLSRNPRKDFSLDASFELGQGNVPKTELDWWLTERYCLYLDRGRKLYRFDIHHAPWELSPVKLTDFKVHYRLNNFFTLPTMPDSYHYSPGVKVVAWREELL